MCKGLIGKKIGMMSVFTAAGELIPATVVKAGPCVVTQIKSVATDGYNAIQLGFEEKKSSRVNKPQTGHFSKSGDKCFAFLKEVPVDNPEEYTLGQAVGTDLFKVGEKVDVVGTTKGRGFSGVIKRHGFGGGRMSHGSKSKRIPGSIGCSAWPSRVFKGKRLPGHYGVERKTIRNLEIIDIRPDNNLIMLKGPVPGAKTSLLTINKLKFEK